MAKKPRKGVGTNVQDIQGQLDPGAKVTGEERDVVCCATLRLLGHI